MEIRITYKGTLHGVRGMWCGFKPEGVEVEEEIKVLIPAAGMDLKSKATGDIYSSVILKENTQDEFEEVEHVDRHDRIEPDYK